MYFFFFFFFDREKRNKSSMTTMNVKTLNGFEMLAYHFILKCPYCAEMLAYYFILKCPYYNDIYKNVQVYKLTHLNTDTRALYCLGKYLMHVKDEMVYRLAVSQHYC